jgi:hypothetical protein
LKVTYSNPTDTGITMERAQKLNSEEFESSSKEDIKDEKNNENKVEKNIGVIDIKLS